MGRVLRYLAISIGVFLGIAIVAFLIVANFSAKDTAFRCEGKLTIASEEKPATLFMTLSEYRWWVGLWSHSDGMVSIQAPQFGVPYIPYLGLEDNGEFFHIFDYVGSTRFEGFRGQFYKLSRYLGLDTKSAGVFDGQCIPIER